MQYSVQGPNSRMLLAKTCSWTSGPREAKRPRRRRNFDAASPCTHEIQARVRRGRSPHRHSPRRGQSVQLDGQPLIGAAQRSNTMKSPAAPRRATWRRGGKRPALVQLLQRTLAEEENADQLLNQVVRPLMSAARMPLVLEGFGNRKVAATNNRN
jgi:hypothetical protein